MSAVAFVACAASREIVVLGESDGGSWKIAQRIPTAGAVMPLALSPDRKILYASLRTSPFSVASFAVSPAGRLEALATAALPDNMAYLATDRSGMFLLSASYSGGKLAVNRIERPGMVRSEPVAMIGQVPNAHSILAAPDNRFVYAASLGSDRVLAFRFDSADGTLTPIEPARATEGAGPRHIAFDREGGTLYCINELNATVAVYARDRQTGTLHQRQTADCAPPGFVGRRWAADLAMTPDGRFLYATERTSSTVSGFAVRPDGTLIRSHCVETERQPRGIAIDPSGRFLLAAGQLSHAVSIYTVASDGTLAVHSRIAVGEDPNWIAFL
jgi:6-phosphogluconolactonase